MVRAAFASRILLIGLAAASLPDAAAVAANPPPDPAAAGEPRITVPGPEGDYLRALHTQIHYRFANKFIEAIAAKQPPSDPLNRPGLRTQLLFGIRWDGSVSDVLVNEKSGVASF